MANKYTKVELAGIIEQEISQAQGAESDELKGHIEHAQHYYWCRMPEPGDADESRVVSSDLRDMVNATLAQLTPMISNDALVTFEPKGSQDEEAARMEVATCNTMIMDRNQGFVKLQACVKDACLKRNTFAKVWPEEMTSVETRRIQVPEGTTAAQVARVMNEDPDVEAEIVEDKDLPTGVAKVKIKSTRTAFRWRPVDPARFYYATGFDEHDLQNIRFCAERTLKSRSDLVAMGYSKAVVAELPPSTHENQDTAVRAQDRDPNMMHDAAQTHDQELVDYYECYLLVDMDGDGIAERWKICAADKKIILDYEMVDVVPYAAGTIMVRSHRLQGEDLYDHLKETQDIKTGAKRRWLDNTRAASFARTGAQTGVVDPKSEDARSGQFVWTKGPPAEALLPLPVVDVGPSLLSLLDYEDRHRTEAGGAALDMQTSGANIAGETWRGIAEQYTVKEMLASMFAKNLGETLIRQMYLLMHRMLRTQSDRPIMVRFKDQWQAVNAFEWPARDEMNVLPGLTARARMAHAQALQTGLEFSMVGLQQGLAGILVDPDGIYKHLLDLYAAAGIDSPQQYWVDPKSERARKNAEGMERQKQQQFEQQLLLMERQLEALRLEHVVAARNKAIDAQVDLYKADLDAQTDLAQTILKEGAENERAQQAVEQSGEALAGAGGGRPGQGARSQTPTNNGTMGGNQ